MYGVVLAKTLWPEKKMRIDRIDKGKTSYIL